MAAQLALAGAVAERRADPEVARGARRLAARARQREVEQRVDASRLVAVVLECGGPPDVGTRLEHYGRGIGRVFRRQRGEARGRAGEVTAIQRVEAGPELGPTDELGGAGGGRALEEEQRGPEEPHVIGAAASRGRPSRGAP